MMDISYIALNRIVEDRIAKDRAYRKEIEKSGKIVLSSGQKMSDAEILKKLDSFNVKLDKKAFSELYEKFLSAEEMSEWITENYHLRLPGLEEDWIWICLTVLWERWFPERPSLEMIDDKMQEGYKRMDKDDSVGACKIWLDVWQAILNIMDSKGLEFLRHLDNIFRGTQSLFNWVQDLEMELGNAGREDPKYSRDRISFCEGFLARFPHEDTLVIENMKRAIAESHFEMGEADRAGSIFRNWLKEDPKWGWGWIGWSDGYWFLRRQDANYEKAEEILKEGLSVMDVRNRDDLLGRLESIYSKTGRKKDAEEIRQKKLSRMKSSVAVSARGNVLRFKETFDFGEEGLPLDQLENLKMELPRVRRTENTGRKVGRNNPCPCGSGKKFKKCCGR